MVARQLRGALDELGHDTFVLARPTRATNIRPSWVDRSDVWDQPGVSEASAYEIPWDDYQRWSDATRPEIVMFDQNYGFEEVERLRANGIRTIGRFVWEHFSAQHVEPAGRAFETIYSLTGCERERYAEFGIESPRVRWGCHPSPFEYAEDERPRRAPIRFTFPGGFMSKRKPFEQVIAAFSSVKGRDIRLTFKAQVERRRWEIRKLTWRDSRIEVIWDDLPTDRHLRGFAACDVCLAPSRWEGLGLHLYEATALGLPIICNDNPPMNEVVRDGENGLLVAGIADGTARSGITGFRPNEQALAAAIARIRDPELLSELSAGARAARERLAWSNTVADLDALLRP